MHKFIIIGALAAALGGVVFVARTGDEDASSKQPTSPDQGATMVEVAIPDALSAQARMGRTAFEAACAACHGRNAAGNADAGPPLVHRIYEPSHHGDMAFRLAVQNGVRAHHWTFGNMPAQEGLTRAEVTAIIAYVRALQRENGIQ